MDFFSNIIKPRISSVLNDSMANEQQTRASTSTTPSIPINTSSPSTSFIATAMNTSINAISTADSFDRLASSAAAAASANNSRRNSPTAQTISEMLQQINENIDQAIAKDKASGNNCTAFSPNACFRELSPAAFKSIGVVSKMTPLPRPQRSAPSTPNAETAAVTGLANFETNAMLNEFPIAPEFEAVFCLPSQLNLDSNKYRSNGLNECEEASISELSDGAIDELQDQFRLKLLNDDDTDEMKLTSSVETICSSLEFIDNHGIPKNFLLVNKESETATSSDNETFSECQSFRSLQAEPADISENENYRSANNSNDSGASNIDIELNSTFKNVTAFVEESNLEVTPKANKFDVTFENEPMDIDLSISSEEHVVQYTVNMATEAKPTLEKQIDFGLDKAVAIPQNPAAGLLNVENSSIGVVEIPLADSMRNSANVKCDLQVEESEKNLSLNKTIEMADSTEQKDNFQTCADVLHPTTNYLTQAAAGAGDFIGNSIELVSEKEVHEKNIVEELSTSFENFQVAAIKEISTSQDKNIILDLKTSYENAKTSPLPSPTFPIKHLTSATEFPRFPEVVDNDNGNSMKFVETSEYPEYPEQLNKNDSDLSLQSSQPISSPVEINFTHSVPEASTLTNSLKLNKTNDGLYLLKTEIETIDLRTPEIIEETTSSGKFFENTKKRDAFGITTSEDDSNLDEKRRTFNITENIEATLCDDSNSTGANRRTFNVLTKPTIVPVGQTEKRLTFNVSNNGEIAPLNQNFEPMEIDVKDFDPTAYSPAPLSPPVPALLKAMQPTDEIIAQMTTATENSIFKAQTVTSHNQTEKTNEEASIVATTDEPIYKTAPVSALQSLEKKTDETSIMPTTTEETIFKSPPVPALQNRKAMPVPIPASRARSPPIPTLQKRPPIHPTAVEKLSVKEQAETNATDDKDSLGDKFAPPTFEEMFTSPSNFEQAAGAFGNTDPTMQSQYTDKDFNCNTNLILNSSDFDYLLSKGNNNVQVDRSSLLLKFDPLLGCPVPVNYTQNRQQQHLQQILANNNNINSENLVTTIEEKEEDHSKEEQHIEPAALNEPIVANDSAKLKKQSSDPNTETHSEEENAALPANYVSMSVEVIQDMNIENDCKKSYDNSITSLDEKQNNFRMDGLEKKMRNEVHETEDMAKKLKEAELREEALIKRITDKDKTISKMGGVIEAYERAIPELITEKEVLKEGYEKQLAEAKADRDSYYYHLASLETTFSDLHVKYEKSKEMTAQLKASEEALLAEKRQCFENLRQQEQRYERMKGHAMQQLEIANKKLEAMSKEHTIESTKLKALLKKEEISRASFNEQLQQKSRENEELMKICDELINGQGS